MQFYDTSGQENSLKSCSPRHAKALSEPPVQEKIWPFPRRYSCVPAQEEQCGTEPLQNNATCKTKRNIDKGTVRTSCTRRCGPFLGVTLVFIKDCTYSALDLETSDSVSPSMKLASWNKHPSSSMRRIVASSSATCILHG